MVKHVKIQSTPLIDYTSVLKNYQQHRLVQGRFYFLLPPALLNTAASEICKRTMDTDQLAMDLDLGKLMEDDPRLVALYCGVPRSYPYLGPELYASRSIPADSRAMPKEKLQPYLDALREADEPLDVIHSHARAYAGWLVSNPRFLQEHRQVLASYKPTQGDAREWTMPMTLSTAGAPAGIRGDRVKPSAARLIEGWKSFYQRWRLSELAAPGLPVPYLPQRGTSAPAFVPTHLHPVVHTVISTGIFPQVDRDLIERTAPTGGDDNRHLQDWMKIASLSNRRRTDELTALGRRFQLQHYWRVLHQRYPQVFHRNARRLEAVFAKHLGVKPATVRADLQHLRNRLGNAWHLAGFPTTPPQTSTR